MPAAGLEPARPFGPEILSLVCLPIPSSGQFHQATRAARQASRDASRSPCAPTSLFEAIAAARSRRRTGRSARYTISGRFVRYSLNRLHPTADEQALRRYRDASFTAIAASRASIVRRAAGHAAAQADGEPPASAAGELCLLAAAWQPTRFGGLTGLSHSSSSLPDAPWACSPVHPGDGPRGTPAGVASGPVQGASAIWVVQWSSFFGRKTEWKVSRSQRMVAWIRAASTVSGWA